MQVPAGERVEALLFDLGRVVIDFDNSLAWARWAELARLPVAAVEHRYRTGVADSEAFRRHERGQLSDAAFFAHLRGTLQVDLTYEQLVDGWNSIFVGEMPGVRRLLSGARDVLPIYAFTNSNAVHQAYCQGHFAELLAPFRKVYSSHLIGARKPEMSAFHAVAADMGVPPQRILFLDDLAANVAGAKASGMRAAHVTAVTDIERALSGLMQ